MTEHTDRINREMLGPIGPHAHAWGDVDIAPMTGNPHRKCTVEGCRFVSLDLSDDECCESGYLIEQTYGETDPTDPRAVFVQRCDECEFYDSDLSAAKAYASGFRGRIVWAIGNGQTMAPQSDAWVGEESAPIAMWAREVDGVRWIPAPIAVAVGMWTREVDR